MPQSIGMLTAGMSTGAVARECNFNFSTICRLQHRIREFGQPASQRQTRYRVGEHVADVNVVKRVHNSGGGVMVWTGINYALRTQLHFIDGNLNAQRYHDEILRPIVMSIICRHHLMFHHDDA